MPSPTTTDLPIPKSWDEFEDICADLLKRLWHDPYVVRHGRAGQRQHGVDIYGKPVHLQGCGSGSAGAQCKRVVELTEGDIRNEIEQTPEFVPKLEEFLILTTLKRDASLQKYVRTQDWPINRVEILFWEDLSLQFSEFDELLQKHFSGWFQTRTSKEDLIQRLSKADPEDFEYSEDGLICQYSYKADVDLRLVIDLSEEISFEEPWVSKFEDPEGYKQKVYLEYSGTRIEKFCFVYVDGGRYCIPSPKSRDDLRISPFQYRLACILNQQPVGYGIDHGLEVAGITVDNALAT